MATPRSAEKEAPADGSSVRSANRRARTRAKLLTAARVVFERDGFHAARLSDIVNEADVSIGTFYNYYSSKTEIIRDLFTEVTAELVSYSESPSAGPTQPDLVARIEDANRSYVRGYRHNAKLMSILYQMAERDPEISALGREIRGAFEARISRAIGRWQREGLAWPDLDPVYAANALAYMVDRFLYEWETLDLDYDEDKVVDTLSRLWARGLGLERPKLVQRRDTAR